MNTPADDLPTLTAEEFLAQVRKRQPSLYRLALVLSPAWRIEPLLLRNVRRAFFPEAPTALEAQLWHSDLVASRSALAVVLRRDLADLLVKDLGTSRDWNRLWRFVLRHTRHWPTQDQLAQELRVAALLERNDELIQLLNQALALIDRESNPERRRDLARWAKVALHDWPDTGKSPTALGWLAQFAGAGVGDPLGDLARPMAAADRMPDWLAERVPPPAAHLSQEGSLLGLRLGEGILECVDPDTPDAEPLPLPGPAPYPVLLGWEVKGERRLRWESLWPERRIDLGDPDCRDLLLQPLQGEQFRLVADGESTEGEATATPAAEVVGEESYRITANVNLRSGPGIQHEILPQGTLPEGTLVKVLDGEGQWRLVKLWGASRAATDIAGWVHGRYLEKVADGDVAETSVERAALDLERRLVPEPGLYRCVGIDRFEEVPVNPEELSEARPLLLLLPGLASNAQGTFGEIWQPSNSAFLRYLRARFEEDILAFNYWSLSRHPIENTLDLVERLPAGSRLMIVGHSVGGLIGELICRTARVDAKEPFTEEEISWFSNTAQRQHSLIRLSEELQHKRLRVERFIAVATPFRGHSLFHKSKKLLAVLPSLAKVLNVGGRLLSTPEFEALLRALGHPEELPGLEAMLPESPFLHLINSPKTEVDCELSVITGDTEAHGILAKLGNIAMDKVLGEENDLVVPTASMVGGAHRTGLARLAAFKGPEINHFNYFADRRVLDGIRQALDSPDAGGIWRPLRTAGSPQSR